MTRLREELQEALMAQHTRVRQDNAKDVIAKEKKAEAEADEKALFTSQLGLMGSFATVAMGFRKKPQQMTMDLINLAKNALVCFGAVWGQASHQPVQPSNSQERSAGIRVTPETGNAKNPSMESVPANFRSVPGNNGGAPTMEAIG